MANAIAENIAIYAQIGGIAIPQNCSVYNPQEYPHWHIFKALHLGSPASPSIMTENASIIVGFPVEVLEMYNEEDLKDFGVNLYWI